MSCKEYVDFIISKGPRKGEHVKIKCGKCVLCRIDRRREWQQRIMWEFQSCNYKGWFCTLTYRDECLGDNNLDYSEIQKFIKKLRKRSKVKFKYYCAGEYGETTSRKHWHILILGDVNKIHILHSWTFGGCDIRPINPTRIRYTLKYLEKEDWFNPKLFKQFNDKTPPCHHMSNGIGRQWLLDNFEKIQDGELNYGRKKIPVPRYYRDKFGLPSPSPSIDPDKKRQIEEFVSGGITYIRAYGLVYGSYASSISHRLKMFDAYSRFEYLEKKKAIETFDKCIKDLTEDLT